jgi:hypothetical protein
VITTSCVHFMHVKEYIKTLFRLLISCVPVLSHSSFSFFLRSLITLLLSLDHLIFLFLTSHLHPPPLCFVLLYLSCPRNPSISGLRFSPRTLFHSNQTTHSPTHPLTHPPTSFCHDVRIRSCGKPAGIYYITTGEFYSVCKVGGNWSRLAIGIVEAESIY